MAFRTRLDWPRSCLIAGPEVRRSSIVSPRYLTWVFHLSCEPYTSKGGIRYRALEWGRNIIAYDLVVESRSPIARVYYGLASNALCRHFFIWLL